MAEHLAIFDTTLRDGLQTPGLPAISREDRLRIAQMLESMGVDVIEAGFPSSSPENFASVELIAQHITKSTICVLAMATRESIMVAVQALRFAKHKRIHIVLGSSKTHLGKLSKSKEEMVACMENSIRFAAQFFEEIEFSPEDAGRTDIEFLIEVAKRAIGAGATVINIPDTVGFCMTEEYGERIRTVISRVGAPRSVTWSVHCHDDFGCATANTLAGVRAGARQIEGTLYNIGERAGNTAIEEVVMAVRKRQDYFVCDSKIDTSQFWKAARLVEEITKVAIPPNKAVVGKNAFSHESGIHQDGVLKDPSTYEVMDPKEVGWQGRSLTLGPQSGSHAVRDRMRELDISVSENAFPTLFAHFKEYADRHGPVCDDTLRAIAKPFAVSAFA